MSAGPAPTGADLRRTGVGVRGMLDRELDVTTYLTWYLVLLFGISAYQRIGALGAIGHPSLLVAAGAATAWVGAKATPSIQLDRHVNPMRLGIYAYVWYALAIFAKGHTRSLTALEQTGSVREAIVVLALAGLSLAVMDGVRNLERLETLLRRLTWAGAWLASYGIVQFFTGATLTFRIPGLTLDRSYLVGQRSIFNRPAGTAQHPIEFSVVLAALLPLALYFALESPSGSRRQRVAIAACFVMGLGIPLSISRTGVIVVATSLLVVGFAWTWRRRAQALIVLAVAVPGLWLVIPGLVGTFRSMFVNSEHDPSVQARLERVPRFMELIREYPLFGRGLGTFSPEDYLLADNEVYSTTIELGLVGIVLTFALFLLAALLAVTSQHHPLATNTTRHLGWAIAAGIIGIAVSFTTFDAMFFVILRAVLFLLIGAAGALWRLTRQPPPPRGDGIRALQARPAG